MSDLLLKSYRALLTPGSRQNLKVQHAELGLGVAEFETFETGMR
jgi:hypothetical protein